MGAATPGTSPLWRRLDLPGHDSAILTTTGSSSLLRGMAVFRDERGPTALKYDVRCDGRWITTEAHIQGWRAGLPIELIIRRDPTGRWVLSDSVANDVDGCLDLDLSFTPATNVLPLRRLGLSVGQRAEVRSAWLEWPEARLTPLVQRYHRQSAMEYEYEADLPDAVPFTAALRVDSDGWVVDYAGLWRAEPL